MAEHPPALDDLRREKSPAVAVRRLMDEHGARLLDLAQRFCGSRAEAEDLVQDTLVQALRKWHTFTGRSSPTTWLYTIAARACRRRRRGRRGSARRPVSLDALLPLGEVRIGVVPKHDEPGARLDRTEWMERVETAVASLPIPSRMPFVLREIVGFAPEEIGAILGLQTSTVNSRVHRARLLVRAELARSLPRRAVPRPEYSREVCLDLLAAKQRALDRGVAFRFERGVFCERCSEVFAGLDLAHDLCASLETPPLPAALRREILRRARAAESPRRRKPKASKALRRASRVLGDGVGRAASKE